MKKTLLSLILGAAVLFGAEAQNDPLEAAYQKEFAFLKAQKRELQKRFDAMQTEHGKKLSGAKTGIDRLQQKMLTLTSRSEMLSEQLLEAERNEQDVQDNSAILEGVVFQAASTLQPYGVAVDTESKAYDAVLAGIFKDGVTTIATLSSVRTEPGSFFLADGTKVDGEIVKLGNIASYGIAGNTAGALAPAGNGLLKLWDTDAAASASAVAGGEHPESIGFFLYESLNNAVEQAKEKTALSVIQSGGMIAWVIVILGAVALLLIALRIVFLNRANANTHTVTDAVISKVKSNDMKAALNACQSKQGATARVLSATIRNIDRDREHLDDIIAESILHENGFLDRFGSVILVIAAVAPLLGLLGTVTGMISTFDVITEFGTGDPKLLSGGISEALVTTELGLIVAIPALLVGNLLSGWAERIKDHMEQAALRVSNVYIAARG
jgi:biopolymer transport protein ExbB